MYYNCLFNHSAHTARPFKGLGSFIQTKSHRIPYRCLGAWNDFFNYKDDMYAKCTDLKYFLMSFLEMFRFWRPAGLQVPVEVDFRSQKRKQSSPFWTLNSIFRVQFFIIFLYRIQVAFWTRFESIWEATWSSFWILVGVIF